MYKRQRVNKARETIMDILSPWFDFAANAEGHTGAEWGTQLYGCLLYTSSRYFRGVFYHCYHRHVEKRPILTYMTNN